MQIYFGKICKIQKTTECHGLRWVRRVRVGKRRKVRAGRRKKEEAREGREEEDQDREEEGREGGPLL